MGGSKEPIPWTGVDDYVPDFFEILLALRQLRNGAPGEDRLQARWLQRGSLKLKKALVKVVQTSWEEGKVPAAFQRALVVAIPKKPGAAKWDDHRGITLLSVASKVLARVLLNRARAAPVHEMQHGFRQGNSTVDAIQVVTNVMSECRRVGIPAVATFVDLTKAYDTVPRNMLWDTCERQGLRGQALTLAKALYDDSISVRMGTTVSSKQFSSTQGVRQGCLLSPLLFSWVFDRVLLEAEPHISGIPMRGRDDAATRRVKMRAYADDVVILSPNMRAAQRDFDHFDRACTRAGLTVSVDKTKTLALPNNMRTEGPTPVDPFQRTDDGVPYFVYPDKGTGAATCPFAGCEAKFCSEVPELRMKGLRKHFNQIHKVSVAVLESAPVRAEVPNLEKLAAGPGRGRSTRCGECGATFPSIKEGETHCRAAGHVHVTWKVTGTRQGTELKAKDSMQTLHLNKLKQMGLYEEGDQPPAVTKDGKPFEMVSEFRYLGRIISADGDDTAAIRARISGAAQTAGKLLGAQLRRASAKTKLDVWNSVIRAQLLYGAESWCMTQRNRSALAAFEMRWLRRATGNLPRRDRHGDLKFPRNQLVRREANTAPLVDLMDRARLRYYGHALRKPSSSVVRFTMDADIPEIGWRGGAHASARHQLRELMHRAGLQPDDASNRRKWREQGDAWLQTQRQDALGAAWCARVDASAAELKQRRTQLISNWCQSKGPPTDCFIIR